MFPPIVPLDFGARNKKKSDCSVDSCWIDCAFEEEADKNFVDGSGTNEEVEEQPDKGPEPSIDLMTFSDSEESDLCLSKFANLQITASYLAHIPMIGGGSTSSTSPSASIDQPTVPTTKKSRKSRSRIHDSLKMCCCFLSVFNRT